jgi:hypothetical protein
MLKYFNHELDGSDIPLNVGDRYYGQDRLRDFFSQREYATILLQKIVGSAAHIIIDGLVVTQGTGHTINITAGSAIITYTTKFPNSWAAIPPTMTIDTFPLLTILDPALTNQAITSAVTDGVTTNYVKLAYNESPGSNRSRAKKTGSYDSEVTPGYTLSVDDTAPTSTEFSIATFTSDGATLTFTGVGARYSPNNLNVAVKSSTYTATAADDVILCSSGITINLPAYTSVPGKVFYIKNMDGTTITIDGNASETIDGATTQIINVKYNVLTIVAGPSEWSII